MPEVVGGVLGVLRSKRVHGVLVPCFAGFHERRAAVDPDPAKLPPVLVPAIREERDVGPGHDVPDAREGTRIVGSLRLLVDRCPDPRRPRVQQHEADRHQPRRAVGADGGEGGGPGRGDEGPFAWRHLRIMRRTARRLDSVVMTERASDTTIPPTRHVTTARIVAVRGGSLEVRADRVVGEEPMEIRAAGPGQEPVAVAVTMRTPGFEDELAVGFLRTEGLIEGPEVLGVETGDPATLNQPDDTVIVRLATPFDASRVAERHFIATASCGICGKASLDEVAVRCAPIPLGTPVVTRTILLALPDALRAAQKAFDETGGLHASALFTPRGELLVLREDVGRHNALDKVIGSQVLARRLPLSETMLMVSGRVSFELVQKAAVAGIPIVAAVSAPSDLAIQAAERLGVTLVGFLRGDGFNVYSHDNRIDLRDLVGWA